MTLEGVVMLLLLINIAVSHVHYAVETEMFAIPISPNLFNWTYQEFDQQYRFHASLQGKPELPSWLRYIYSGRHHSGFIFGTPPRATKAPIVLEVIGLNRQDYETRRVLLTLNVKPKENMARHEVELKIDNLNVEDLLDEHRMTRLKEILKTRLWIESNQDLYTTFLASAIDLGARLPLRPSDGEGLVVRLGSSVPFSTQLKWLREEVRPLSRLPSCPREYKRTTSERLFRDAGFTLDWCNFELYNTIYRERSTDHLEYLTEVPNSSKGRGASLSAQAAWAAPLRHALPQVRYGRALAAAAAPLLLLLPAAAALAALLCVRLQPGPSGSLGRANLAASYGRPQPPPYLARRSPHSPDARQLALEQSLKLLNDANIAKPYDYDSLQPDTTGYVPMKPDGIRNKPDAIGYSKPEGIGYDSLKPEAIGYTPMKPDGICRSSKPDGYGTDEVGYTPKPDGTGYVSMKKLDDIEVPDLTKFGIGPI
ncbi:hypothetical protein ACJJTC_014325 [Scirpophaga incertulas]